MEGDGARRREQGCMSSRRNKRTGTYLGHVVVSRVYDVLNYTMTLYYRVTER